MLKIAIVRRLGLQVGFFLIFSALLAFLSLDRARINPDTSELALETAKPLPSVSIEQMQAFVKEGTITTIDARSTEEYQKGHVQGAISLPAGELDSALAHHLELFSMDKPIVVYCGGSGCDLSELVARKLVFLGMDQVSIFSSGWNAWENAGLPIEP